jgi:hypothetical protein
LHDDTLDPENRVAGLLVLLYAQQPAAIGRLATEVPAAVPARMLGIRIAVAWQRASAGDWTSYAAEVSRRPSPPPWQ